MIIDLRQYTKNRHPTCLSVEAIMSEVGSIFKLLHKKIIGGQFAVKKKMPGLSGVSEESEPILPDSSPVFPGAFRREITLELVSSFRTRPLEASSTVVLAPRSISRQL
jgi:hypothetical protein